MKKGTMRFQVLIVIAFVWGMMGLPLFAAAESAGGVVITPPPQEQQASAPEVPEIIYYKVTFYDCAGNVIKTYDVEEGKLLQKPDFTPALAGHTFSHWYNAAVGTRAFDFKAPITKAIKLKPFMLEVMGTVPEEKPTAAPTAKVEEPTPQPSPTQSQQAIVSTPQVTASPTSAPTLTPAPAPADPRSVHIALNVEDEVRINDTVIMMAVLRGFEDTAYKLVWQCDTGNGNGWQDVLEDEMVYSFSLAEDNYYWNWRVVVTIIEPAKADAA